MPDYKFNPPSGDHGEGRSLTKTWIGLLSNMSLGSDRVLAYMHAVAHRCSMCAVHNVLSMSSSGRLSRARALKRDTRFKFCFFCFAGNRRFNI